MDDDKLRSVLGIATIHSVMKNHSLAIVDATLSPIGEAS
jgi:hypothetical protein